MTDDPYYTTKDRKCKSCGEMNTGSDTCSGPCGQCWSCNCDCEGTTPNCECDNLPDDHPDWMKGMCEICYDRWAEAMNNAYKGDA